MSVVINFRPSVKQYEAWQYLFDKKTLFIGYGGAAFGGKSYLIAYWLTTMCIAYPETSWGLGRRELVNLKKTTLLTLFKVFDECGIKPDEHYKYNQQLNFIEFSNGSIIYLIDMAYQPRDPLFTRFGGLELTGAAIDESAESEYKAIEILFTRLGRKNNHKYDITKKMLEAFNPAKNHVYHRYYKPSKDGFTNDHTVFIPALPADNPSPEVDDYISGILKTADNVTIQRLIYGNFEYDDNPNALFDYNDILNVFTNSFVPAEGKRYITADIAYEGSDRFVIAVWHGWVVKEIIAIDKIDETMVSKKIHDIRIKNMIPINNVCYDADGLKRFVRESGKSGHLQGAKEFHNGGSPIKVNGRAENFFNLKSQCYYLLAEKVRKNEVYIQDQIYRKQIIEELEQICKLPISDDGKIRLEPKDAIRERLGRSPDFADVLMMRVHFDIKTEYTIGSSAARA